MSKPSLFLILLLGCIPLFATGCGKSFPVASVSGTVTLNGKPLADHQIGFVAVDPKAAGFGATGITDTEGRFSMKTTTGKTGCPVGLCKVYIKWNMPDSVKEEMAKSLKPISIPAPVQLPLNASNGSLTFDVPADGTDSATIEL